LPARIATLFLALFPFCTTYAGSRAIFRAPEPVPGVYMVLLRGVPRVNVPTAARDLVSASGGTVRRTFQHAVTAFSANLTETQAIAIAGSPLVEFVEEVAVVHPSTSQPLPSNNSLWHLDRIDQNSNMSDYEYKFCERGGGEYVYMIGTGVYRDHVEFRKPDGTSRVVRGASFTGDNCRAPYEDTDYGYWPCAVGTSDPNYSGHDTACASVLGGNTYGVAKSVTFVPLRTVSYSGGSSSEYMTSAVDWIMDQYSNPYWFNAWSTVVSISAFYFTQSPTETVTEMAISALTGHPMNYPGTCGAPAFGEWPGVPVVVSANNQNTSQSYTSPARMAFSNTSFAACGHVISVGGVDEADARWVCNPSIESCAAYSTWNATYVTSPPTGSNYGATVDIYAPAHNLTIAGIAGNDALAAQTALETRDGLRSGTSYAAPIVAGVVARIGEAVGYLYDDNAWNYLLQSVRHAAVVIDSTTGNDRIIHRDGSAMCNPELP
jgi:hypothetical protein